MKFYIGIYICLYFFRLEYEHAYLIRILHIILRILHIIIGMNRSTYIKPIKYQFLTCLIRTRLINCCACFILVTPPRLHNN